SRRPRPRDDAAPRPHPRGALHRAAAPAHARHRHHAAIQRLCPTHPRLLQRPRRGRDRMNRDGAQTLVLRALLMVASLLAWEAIVRGFAVPAFILPPPSRILAALYRGFASAIYPWHLWVTLSETLMGFALGAALGFCLGTAVALSRRVEQFLY